MSCANRKLTHPRLPNTSQYKVLLYRSPLVRNSSVKFSPPFGGLRWTCGVENGTNRNLVPTLLFDFYTHYRPILHLLATIHNVADRQTDRAISIGRLCYNIGGPKKMTTADFMEIGEIADCRLVTFDFENVTLSVTMAM